MRVRRLAFYPSCAGTGIYSDEAAAAEKLLRELGYDVVSMGDRWLCCGGGMVEEAPHGVMAVVAATAINLRVAVDELGAEALVTNCAVCYHTLNYWSRRLEQYRVALERKGVRLPSRLPQVLHVVDLLHARRGELTGLEGRSVYLYPGCRYSSARGLTAAERVYRELVEAAGGRVAGFGFTCCGFPQYAPRPKLAAKLASRVLGLARSAGADVVLTGCPFCKLMLTRFRGPGDPEARMPEELLKVRR